MYSKSYARLVLLILYSLVFLDISSTRHAIAATQASMPKVKQEDSTGDGKIDTIKINVDGDGNTDLELKIEDGDEIPDKAKKDTDGDGKLDIEYKPKSRAENVDGDGELERLHVDIDDDGKIDLVIFLNDINGEPTRVEFDLDGDETREFHLETKNAKGRYLKSSLIQDLNGDGREDHIFIDLDFDGNPDAGSTLDSRWRGKDTNGDGKWNWVWEKGWWKGDTDGDGYFDEWRDSRTGETGKIEAPEKVNGPRPQEIKWAREPGGSGFWFSSFGGAVVLGALVLALLIRRRADKSSSPGIHPYRPKAAADARDGSTTGVDR